MWPFTPSYPTVGPDDIHDQTFDYVIVGGGTAGCVLASRLSETPDVSVLVLEKGQVGDNFLSRIPLLSQNYEFRFLQSVLRLTERDTYTGRPPTELWAAEALGGTSRINALLWARGWPGNYMYDLHSWNFPDWTWDKVEPYFKRIEEVVKPRKPKFELGCIPFVEDAARRVGLPVGQGVNDAGIGAQGCFVMDQTVDGNGQRMSAYKAWLPPHVARERKDRLKICVGVVASKLLFSKNNKRVTGVQLRQGDRDYTINARREVIVCAGALCSPQLLMLSGIGPYGYHKRLGITLIHEREILGKYHDHVSVPIMMELPHKHTFHCLENVFIFFWHLFLYVFFGKGLLANGSTSRSIFVSTPAIDQRTMTVRHDYKANGQFGNRVPNVEIMINPVNCLPAPVNIGSKSLFTWYPTVIDRWTAGRVQLASNDPMDDPKISAHPLIGRSEEEAMQTAIRFTMRLADEFARKTGYPHQAKLVVAPGMDLEYLDSFYQPKKGLIQALWTWIRKKRATADQQPVDYRRFNLPHIPDSHDPYSSAALSKRFPNLEEQKKKRPAWQTVSSEEIKDYMDRFAVSTQHISSTCRIGWVVNEKLQVSSVQNLRVADASVLPRIPSGHPMAPVMMVAERCADFIKTEWEEKKTS